MFISKLDDLNQIWEFRLIGGYLIIGRLVQYTKFADGNLMMVKINGQLMRLREEQDIGIWDIPWHAVIGVREYRENR